MARERKTSDGVSITALSQSALMEGATAPNHMGEIWPVAHPAQDRSVYGRATLEAPTPVVARSHASFRLTYVCGRFGIDGGGGIRIAFRFTADWGELQFNDPKAENYVTATTSCGLPLHLRYAEDINPRPWYFSLDANLLFGHLSEGDEIVIVFGDRSRGSPGLKMQSCCESNFQFLVLVDPIATGHFVPIEQSPSIPIVSGPAAHWWAVLPSLRRPGERFSLGIRADDRWGNPAILSERVLRLTTNIPVQGLPESLECGVGNVAFTIDGLICHGAGVLVVSVVDERGVPLATSNPLCLRRGEISSYWADFHAQSGETVGINSTEEYLTFARRAAFLDIVSHQANDFQITNDFWSHLNRLTAAHHEPRRFVTFPGYEWSGNTHLGGDRNVIFHDEGRQIRRSSHALISDRSDLATDVQDAPSLFAALKGENAVVFAHCGGRWADLRAGHDGSLETAVEIHSSWGTFEWLMGDALRLGHRVGVVSNSDGHKGRPGANHPGAAYFAAYGGLTCLIAPELTRDAIFASLRSRHHYATTGSRIHMALRASCDGGFSRFDRDPAIFSHTHQSFVPEAVMGDIVLAGSPTSTLSVEIVSPSPIQRIELRDGTDVIQSLVPYTRNELGSRIRIVMSGAERRGKRAATSWKGEVTLHQASLQKCLPVNCWNREFIIEATNDDRVAFDLKTAGNLIGFDLVLDEQPGSSLAVTTPFGDSELSLSDLWDGDRIIGFGGLDRSIRVSRLPDINTHTRYSGVFKVNHRRDQDSAFWICVTTEDGNQAWSSPLYVINQVRPK